MRTGPRYTEAEARAAIAASQSYSEALRRLGMRAAGGNHRTIRRYAEEVWRIPIDHFDPDSIRRAALRRAPAPLAEVLVEHSSYPRGSLKDRLFAEGLKQRCCELCGQGELWRGRAHGANPRSRQRGARRQPPREPADRLPELQRHARHTLRAQLPPCAGRAGVPGVRHVVPPARLSQRYCSRACGQRAPGRRAPQLARRRVARPPYEQLVREIEALGYVGVGRKYGVSDNAIRKWRRSYETAASIAATDVTAPPVQGVTPHAA